MYVAALPKSLMNARHLSLLVVFPALFLGACDDATGPQANVDVITDTLLVKAFTGATTSDPTALNTFRVATVRTETTSGYDVVFDLDAQGRILLYPPSKIASVGRAGLQRAEAAFDAINEAPVSGYNESDIVTAAPGEVYLIRAFPSACSLNIRPFVYSKIVLDSVNVANRTIHFRITANPNCGFRSFAEGRPEF
ncbi:MAG TPA: hypothetical protein VJ672_03565 [Gemmatimonadaceae bacterium]|nr:hypothetical protein [Gemmatimonadaceae bacterium]